MIASLWGCLTWAFATLCCANAASRTGKRKWKVLTYVSFWVCTGFGIVGLILWVTKP